ncbi:hypothetical protein T01_866 [Trichinella spiralis]|uniref:Uncharacterized protein n=1 Tax=Trichinella spiralis TaxID=6334 RepID=A0A0V1B959_TRISP|nr:hypothetical protein T01_866 [Trichinella spiralis]
MREKRDRTISSHGRKAAYMNIRHFDSSLSAAALNPIG